MNISSKIQFGSALLPRVLPWIELLKQCKINILSQSNDMHSIVQVF